MLLPRRDGEVVEHDVPESDRAVAGRGDDLVLVHLGPGDVVQPVLRLKANEVSEPSSRVGLLTTCLCVNQARSIRCGDVHCRPSQSWRRRRGRCGCCGRATKRESSARILEFGGRLAGQAWRAVPRWREEEHDYVRAGGYSSIYIIFAKVLKTRPSRPGRLTPYFIGIPQNNIIYQPCRTHPDCPAQNHRTLCRPRCPV